MVERTKIHIISEDHCKMARTSLFLLNVPEHYSELPQQQAGPKKLNLECIGFFSRLDDASKFLYRTLQENVPQSTKGFQAELS